MSLPLISVIVLTYNSSRFVVETLESVRRQTYAGPIELIISDDLSKDDTLRVCREWVAGNAERFSRVEILATPENTGVSKNCNRGCRNARGEWIKMVAGDDLLSEDCLETFYEAASEAGGERHFFYAPAYSFHTGDNLSATESLELFGNHITAPCLDLDYACRYSLFWLGIPGCFYSRKLLENIGYYPEDFRNVEDAPFIRKVLGAGYTLYHVDKPTVFYRLSEQSITTNYYAVTGMVDGEVQLISIDRYIRPALSAWRRLCLYWRLIFLRLYVATGGRMPFLWKWHHSLEKRLNKCAG